MKSDSSCNPASILGAGDGCKAPGEQLGVQYTVPVKSLDTSSQTTTSLQ